MSASEAFANESKKPSLLTPQEYYGLLAALLLNGEGYGKTESIGAFKLQDITVETSTPSGEKETSRTVGVTYQAGKKEKAYLLFDLTNYPLERSRGQVVKDMAANWGKKTIRERDLDSPDYKAPGIWLNQESKVEFDYMKANPDDPKDSVFKPSPEAYRVTLQVRNPINLPVQWDGGFVVESGGTVAIRERDIPVLAEALKSVREGKATPEKALYSSEGIALIDIYGMAPGIREKDYKPVALKASTQEAADAFVAARPSSTAPGATPG